MRRRRRVRPGAMDSSSGQSESFEPADIVSVAGRFTDEPPRAVFLTPVLNGLRRFELRALRCRDGGLLYGAIHGDKGREMRAG